MTDTTSTTPRRRWTHIFRHSDDDYPLLWHISQNNAQAYALIVALLVPSLGYLLPGDNLPKMWVYFVFYIGTSVFWITEIFEIVFQLQAIKRLDGASDRQRSELQSLYWAVAFIIIVEVIFVAIAGASYSFVGTWRWYGPQLGLADWCVVIHTFFVGKYAIRVLYPLITEIQNMMAKISRFEQ